MAFQGADRLAGGRIPDPHRLVVAAAGQQVPASHGDRAHRIDLALVAFQGADRLAGGRIPDPHRLVVAAAGQQVPAGHGDRAHRPHPVLVAFQERELRRVRQVGRPPSADQPRPGVAVSQRCHLRPPVGVGGQPAVLDVRDRPWRLGRGEQVRRPGDIREHPGRAVRARLGQVRGDRGRPAFFQPDPGPPQVTGNGLRSGGPPGLAQVPD